MIEKMWPLGFRPERIEPKLPNKLNYASCLNINCKGLMIVPEILIGDYYECDKCKTKYRIIRDEKTSQV